MMESENTRELCEGLGMPVAPGVDVLMALALVPDPVRSQLAIGALGALGATDALFELAAGDSEEVALNALLELELVEQPPPGGRLIALLERAVSGAVRSAIYALIARSDAPPAHLEGFVQSTPPACPEERRQAETARLCRGGCEREAGLLETLGETDPIEVGETIERLVESAPPPVAVAVLHALLDDTRPVSDMEEPDGSLLRVCDQAAEAAREILGDPPTPGSPLNAAEAARIRHALETRVAA